MESKEISLSLCEEISAKTQNSEDVLRHKLFRTRCTISERVCELIINGGSYSNLASSYLVERLNLSTVDHPNPYNLKWLDKGAVLKVEKQVWIEFSIGKVYNDRVLCDILPMDACHMLLGRPWEFDRSTMRNGRLNTYSFNFEGKKLTLTPLLYAEDRKVESFRTEEFGGSSLKGESDVPKEVDERDEVESKLAPNHEHKTGASLLPLTKGLLRECPNDCSSELPPGLPPVRGGVHLIPLVPGVPSSSEPPYKSDPTPIQQLLEHDSKMMDVGFAKMSLSICATPTLLARERDGALRACEDDMVFVYILIENDAQLTGYHEWGSLNEETGLRVCVLGEGLMYGTNNGFKPHHFTPHFHYYMLLKIMDSLAHLGTTTYIHELNMGCEVRLLDRKLGDELRGGMTQLIPFTILIYDPGGKIEDSIS